MANCLYQMYRGELKFSCPSQAVLDAPNPDLVCTLFYFITLQHSVVCLHALQAGWC